MRSKGSEGRENSRASSVPQVGSSRARRSPLGRAWFHRSPWPWVSCHSFSCRAAQPFSSPAIAGTSGVGGEGYGGVKPNVSNQCASLAQPKKHPLSRHASVPFKQRVCASRRGRCACVMERVTPMIHHTSRRISGRLASSALLLPFPPSHPNSSLCLSVHSCAHSPRAQQHHRHHPIAPLRQQAQHQQRLLL